MAGIVILVVPFRVLRLPSLTRFKAAAKAAFAGPSAVASVCVTAAVASAVLKSMRS